MSFDRALTFTRREEKGLADDPDDPGGRTYDGVAEHANPDAWRDGVVTEPELLAAYRSRWDAIQGEALPPKLGLALFDWYFQSGAPAVRALQRLVGATEDGVVGEETLARIAEHVFLDSEDADLAMRLIEERAAFLTRWVMQRAVVFEQGVARPARLRFVTGFIRRLARLARAVA